jgi:hypothetical protein
MAEAEAAKVDRGGQPAAESHAASSPAAEEEAPTKPVEPVAAAEPVAAKKPEEEKVGESVIRDVLGATLVATIENGNAADEPSNSDNVAPPPLFDDESDSDD